MKVIAKKILYEQDLYHYPDENVAYGLFPLEIGKPNPLRRGPVLVHRKGEIKEWKFKIEKYCCEPMKSIPEEVIIFKALEIFSGGKLKSGVLSCYMHCPCWRSQEFYRIDFCPSCGEKIEIEKKK